MVVKTIPVPVTIHARFCVERERNIIKTLENNLNMIFLNLNIVLFQFKLLLLIHT